MGDLEDFLHADFYPEMPDQDNVEPNVDTAFVDGIIAMADDDRTIWTERRGQAFETGFRFAHRWGERGKDLGDALRFLRQESIRIHGGKEGST
jgi:hypothetical protein